MADEGAGTGAFTPGAGAGAFTPGAGAGTLAPGAGAGALTEAAGAGTGTAVPWEGTGTAVAGAGTGAVELLTVVKPAGAGTGDVTAAVGGAAAGAVAGEPAPGVGAEALRVVVELGAGEGVSEPVDRVRADSGVSTHEGAFQNIRLGNSQRLHAFAATPNVPRLVQQLSSKTTVVLMAQQQRA
ncbi:TPA: hypothetical protein ACH3X2_008735 [Trebouxia sp. C0005]